MKTYQNTSRAGAKAASKAKPIYFLFGLILTAGSLPLVAQTSETTTTTTTQQAVAPVVQTPVSTTVTTKAEAKTRTLFIRSIYEGIQNGAQVYVRPNGRIYNQDGRYIGHLTNLNADDVREIPSDRQYKIRNLQGTIIASTRLTSLYDADRTITLARQDMNGNVIVDVTETTKVTTAPVVPVPVQSSTTTTTTQAPATSTAP